MQQVCSHLCPAFLKTSPVASERQANNSPEAPCYQSFGSLADHPVFPTTPLPFSCSVSRPSRVHVLVVHSCSPLCLHPACICVVRQAAAAHGKADESPTDTLPPTTEAAQILEMLEPWQWTFTSLLSQCKYASCRIRSLHPTSRRQYVHTSICAVRRVALHHDALCGLHKLCLY